MKTRTEIRTEMLGILAQRTGVNIAENGSIAVAIVDAVLEEIVSLHQELDRMKREAYLSTSSGVYLDEIAKLLDIQRLANESDDELKHRTSQAVHTHAKGNRVAIEQAIRNTPGVATFDFRPYAQGTGSFSVFVYPQPEFNQTRLLANVNASLKEVVAEGIRYDVRVPEEKRIDLALALQFREGLTLMQKQAFRQQARTSIIQYINSLQKGSVLYINELTRRAMSVDSSVLDVSYIELKAGNVQKSISNTFPESDTRFVSGTINVL